MRRRGNYVTVTIIGDDGASKVAVRRVVCREAGKVRDTMKREKKVDVTWPWK